MRRMAAGMSVAVFALSFAAVDAVAAPMCRTNLHGTTFCNDGTVFRTNLHGTRFGSDRRVWRRTLMGTRLSSDGTVFHTARPLHRADGRLWNSDPFERPSHPIGGVACDTALSPASFCR